MADRPLPLLLLSRPTTAERNPLSGRPPKIHKPTVAQQYRRIAPKLEVLAGAFEAKRLKLQQAAPNENPELVVVLETIGPVENFEKAVELDPKDEESIYHLVVLYKFTGNNEKAKALEGRTHR